MTQSRILIVYGTRYGQTEKIAAYARDLLASVGHAVTLARGDALPAGFNLADYDAVLVGGSIIGGRHQKYIERFVATHRAALNAMPSALFSVSGSAANRDPRGRIDAQRCIDALLRKTGWKPALTEPVAGAMAFTKYNPFFRFVLTIISRRAGGPTDTSRDHEMTDWEQVRRFVVDFGAMVASSHPMTNVLTAR